MLRERCMNCKCSAIVQQGPVVWTFLVQFMFRDLWNICCNLGFISLFRIGTLLELHMLFTCGCNFGVITLLQETDLRKWNVFQTLILTSLSHNSLAVSRLSFPHIFHHHVCLEIYFIHHVYLEISCLVMQEFSDSFHWILFCQLCILLFLTFNFLNFVLDWHLVFCCEWAVFTFVGTASHMDSLLWFKT